MNCHSSSKKYAKIAFLGLKTYFKKNFLGYFYPPTLPMQINRAKRASKWVFKAPPLLNRNDAKSHYNLHLNGKIHLQNIIVGLIWIASTNFQIVPKCSKNSMLYSVPKLSVQRFVYVNYFAKSDNNVHTNKDWILCILFIQHDLHNQVKKENRCCCFWQ